MQSQSKHSIIILMERGHQKNNPEQLRQLFESLRLQAVSFFGNVWNRIRFRISLLNKDYQKKQAAFHEYIAHEKYQ